MLKKLSQIYVKMSNKNITKIKSHKMLLYEKEKEPNDILTSNKRAPESHAQRQIKTVMYHFKMR